MVKISFFSLLIVIAGVWLFQTEQMPVHDFTVSYVDAKLNHDPWDLLLQKHVDADGNVNYNNFLKDQEKLETYLGYLAANEPTGDWSKEEGLAYYINLYNAATVLLILENYPTQSIKDIRNPWGKKRVFIGNEAYSLGDIEHKILRKMNEPRIHFAINCASYSCPKLLNSALTPPKLESQLQKATWDFVNDGKRNRISADELGLSHIFKWYKKDFTENGSLIAYINAYTTVEVQQTANIDYLKYNWSLNEVE